eukprot:TRINITY_DN15597_c0_g1_i2.p1 TRINITY_DN15597_c0_g1~~TRINITY_DN15597_c0_g1_i2.p1  ORF type:complete len:395 (+),score=42.02 TRINITY_DN15597_c0_g1_i2:254-1438(+)
MKTIRNVVSYGANGSDSVDDTAAFLSAIDSLNTTGGVLYIPTGSYIISSQLSFNSWDMASSLGISIQGDGMGSVITWKGDFTLFYINTTFSYQYTVKDLQIISASSLKSPSSFALLVNNGLWGLVSRFHVYGNTIPFAANGISLIGSNQGLTVRDMSCYQISYACMSISGSASEIRIEGGRWNHSPTSRAGVFGLLVNAASFVDLHIADVSFTRFDTALLLNCTTCVLSFNHISIVNVVFHQNLKGIVVNDNAFISISNTHFNNQDLHGIYTNVGSTADFNIVGGYMQSTGYSLTSCASPSTSCNAISIAGANKFSLIGVTMANNAGRALYITSGAPSEYTITGCRISSNVYGQWMLNGTSFNIMGNTCTNNGVNSAVAGPTYICALNSGCVCT